jgi:hypothetical protein
MPSVMATQVRMPASAASVRSAGQRHCVSYLPVSQRLAFMVSKDRNTVLGCATAKG